MIAPIRLAMMMTAPGTTYFLGWCQSSLSIVHFCKGKNFSRDTERTALTATRITARTIWIAAIPPNLMFQLTR